MSCLIIPYQFASCPLFSAFIDAEPAAKEEESEPAVYPCTICNKVFTVRNYLNKHIRNFHVYEPSTCDICGKTYDNKTK